MMVCCIAWAPEIGGVARVRYVSFRDQANAGEVDATAYITLIDINYSATQVQIK